MERTLDQILAYHCAPVLTGLKPANLVALSQAEFPDLEGQLEGYCRLFARCGVAFRTMCGCGQNRLLLLYRPTKLERALREPLAAVLLERDGYGPGDGLETMLDRLGHRLRTQAEFPHEIGLFLGYPPPLAAVLLERDGYGPGDGLETMLDRLGHRLRTQAEFPHEIGLFLGYPPEDVAGFQRHRGRDCKLCGYWKVYSDVDRAKALFRRYDRCRDRLCAQLAEGRSLAQVLQAA